MSINISQYLFDKYEIEPDSSGSDVSRLCFSSWDENITVKKSKIYTDFIIKEPKNKIESINIIIPNTSFKTNNLDTASDIKLMKSITTFLVSKNLSITNSYYNWFRVASSLSSTFTYQIAEKFYLDLCRLDGNKHDEEKSINLLKSCYSKPSDVKNSFGTIIFLAKKLGFKQDLKSLL